MSQKTLKKGEFLFKEGEKIQSIFLIQSGGVNQCLVKGKKTVDMFQLGSAQVLGEQVILGQNTFNTSAIATTETKILEIPADSLKQMYENAPQMMKVITRSLAERLRLAVNDVRNSKLEKDSTPCPEDQVAKVFGAIFLCVNHKGDSKSTPGRSIIDWTLYKQYCQRVLGESPKRLEQATNILVKLKLALYEMGKSIDNPDGPEEIQRVHFLDLPLVEAFFEFYQYYYFKGGRTDLLKTDELSLQMLTAFVKLSDSLEPDRYGVVSVEFNKIGEYFKEEIGININNDHFTRLEQKGVMMKRRTTPAGVLLQFEFKDFKNTLNSWKILKEIEKWNEKGLVDLDEKEESKKKKTGGPTCPTCSVEVAANAKFCHECGGKISAAA